METASLWEIASHIVQLNTKSVHEARNAYSALLWVPGLDQLRFPPVLKNCKKFWNNSNPKYAVFWDPTKILQKMAHIPFQWNNVQHVRDRLIIAWRLVQLARSIDLARMFRKISFVDQRPFVWLQRKGWPSPRWEEIICLPTSPSISPWHLLQHYVALTCVCPGVNPGTEVLRSLNAPFQPLSANAIGSLTKNI